MWDKPREITGGVYTGDGFEIASSGFGSGTIISGLLEGAVWGAFVVHRAEEVRIISFRRLNKRERGRYGWEED